jgi:signal transduction histidine kinase
MEVHLHPRPWKLVIGIALMLFGFIAWGSSPADSATLSVKFTRIPPKNPGGPLTMGVIKGRVEGPHEGLKLVLYARAGRWYVQPYDYAPFTTIHQDSSWNSATHLGTDYAALLVRPVYVPPAVTDNLPTTDKDVVVVAITEGMPPVWQRGWFRASLVIFALLAILGFYSRRLRELERQMNMRFEERLAERTRIAQELHDTLLQSFLSASMQLHLLADQTPDNSPGKEQLGHILELMGRVIDEGRNTVRGLRPSSDSPFNLEDAFSHLQQETSAQPKAGLRIVVEGSTRTLHPIIRDEVYRIGREAVTNAFLHARATQVEVGLQYGVHELRVLVRDNGCGIDSQKLLADGDDQRGLSQMRERAENIGARLKILSSIRAGTEVDLRVPGRIAFKLQSTDNVSKWLS